MQPRALACALVCVTTAAAQGFVEWRVTTVFERLLVTLGVSMQPGAFGSAFDVGRCELPHEKLFRGYLQPGFDALLAKDAAVVRIGVRALSKGVRAFGRSCERCAPSVAATLLRAADEAGTLAAHEVRWAAGPAGRRELTILVNDVNVSAALLRASRSWFRERYEETGAALGEFVRAVGGAEAADPLEPFNTWRGTDADGRVKTEREYLEHLRAEWARAHAERTSHESGAGSWQGPRVAPPFQGRRDEL